MNLIHAKPQRQAEYHQRLQDAVAQQIPGDRGTAPGRAGDQEAKRANQKHPRADCLIAKVDGPG